jgi:hypothetical protein
MMSDVCTIEFWSAFGSGAFAAGGVFILIFWLFNWLSKPEQG